MTKIAGFSLVLGLLAVGALGCGSNPPPASSTPASSGTTASNADSDGDGILDKDDKCPDKKEDGLAPDPKDGCPKS